MDRRFSTHFRPNSKFLDRTQTLVSQEWTWADLGRLWPTLGRGLGRSWANLGPTLGRLWAHSGPTSGRLVANLGSTFGRLLARKSMIWDIFDDLGSLSNLRLQHLSCLNRRKPRSNPLQGAVRHRPGPGGLSRVHNAGGPKSSKMVRIGSRIDRLARNKDQMNPTACLDPSGPLLRPKTVKKICF